MENSNLTVKDFENEIKSNRGLWNQIEQRNMVFYTNSDGMEKFNHTIRTLTSQIQLDDLRDNGKFTSDEYNRIKEMIDSLDWDNLIVAESIMEQKEID